MNSRAKETLPVGICICPGKRLVAGRVVARGRSGASIGVGVVLARALHASHRPTHRTSQGRSGSGRTRRRTSLSAARGCLLRSGEDRNVVVQTQGDGCFNSRTGRGTPVGGLPVCGRLEARGRAKRENAWRPPPGVSLLGKSWCLKKRGVCRIDPTTSALRARSEAGTAPQRVALHPPGAQAGRRTRQIRDPESLAPDAALVTAGGELFVPSPLSASERSFSADLRALRFFSTNSPSPCPVPNRGRQLRGPASFLR